jgi:hypothetical protein
LNENQKTQGYGNVYYEINYLFIIYVHILILQPLEFRSDRVKVPGEETTYYCSIHLLPPELRGKKHPFQQVCFFFFFF